jgi:hypothetical protein
VRRSLELPEHTDTNTKQAGGNEYAQQRIGRNHRKDVPNQSRDCTRRSSNGGHAARNSLLKNPSFP